MSRLRPATLCVLLFSLLVPLPAFALTHTSQPVAEPRIELPITADDGLPRGEVSIVVRDGPGAPVQLTLQAGGLRPAARYEARLRAGTPDTPSASSGWLGTLDTNPTGSGTLRTSTAAISAAFAVEELTLAALADGPHFIELVASDGSVDARALIPELPIGLGSGAASVGIPAVDAILAAVARGDTAALLARTVLSEVPCVSPEDGGPMGPTCNEGEALGTLAPALPVGGCEGAWAREPLPVIAAFVELALDHYAVVAGPAPDAADAWRPVAEYVVVFTPKPGSALAGLAASISGGGVVAVEMGCREPAALVQGLDGLALPAVQPVSEPVRATVDVYSGRADNPSWVLAEADAVTLLARLAALPAAPPNTPNQPLGYRGVVVELPARRGDPARRVRIFDGLVWDDIDAQGQYRHDPGRALERWLTATAPIALPSIVSAELNN